MNERMNERNTLFLLGIESIILILKLESKVVVTKMVGGGLWRLKGATTPVNF